MKSLPFRPNVLAIALGLALASGARAEMRVLACEPAWAAVVREIGGDRVRVDSATTPQQDPHYIQARPSLIARVRQADLLVCSGADLEVGWLPVLLRQGANAKLAAGEIGSLDRAQGDVHPYGNPHTETDPHNIALVADEVARRLALLDPAGAASYQARRAAFATRWTAALAGWERKAAPLRGMEIVTHHVAWAYLVQWLGLVDVAHLEPKPGIPPSASSLARLLGTLSAHHPRAVVRLAYEPERPSEWLSERLSIPALVLPHAPGATPAATDLFGVFDDAVEQLLKAAL
jgi:zinc/manganese transport system substrate-binding protein